MKKLLVIVCSISIIWCLMIAPVSAASTVFVDKADVGFTKVSTKIGAWQWENNVDVEKTLYSKGPGSKDKEVSLVYKMNGNITAFKIDTLNCNGLGDSTLDIAVYVSSNGTSWTKVEINVTEPVMDPAYVVLETAYWLNSTVTNKNAIPANINYLKISLLPFTRQNMVMWSTVLDDINITYNAKAVTPTKAVSSAPASSTAASVASTVISTANSITENSIASGTSEVTSIDSADTSSDAGSVVESLLNSSEAASSSASAGETGGTNTPIIIGAIVLGALAIGAALYYFLKKRK